MDSSRAISMTSRPSRSCLIDDGPPRHGHMFEAPPTAGPAIPVLAATPPGWERRLPGPDSACGASRARRRRCVRTTRNADAEEPGAKRTGRIQGRPVAVERDEDLLQQILDVARARTQPLQRPEHVVQLPIERLEAVTLRHRHGRGGTNQAERNHRSSTVRTGPIFEENRHRRADGRLRWERSRVPSPPAWSRAALPGG